MQKIFNSFIAAFIAVSGLLAGEIIETAHFHEISKYAKPETLIILDIDDTLLIPVQTLGTDVWFLHRIKQNEAKGLERSAAFEKAIAEWEGIRNLTEVQIVEPGTDKIVESMQNSKITVMGLSTQGLALATRTVQQLQSLNIDLSKTAPSAEDHYFMNKHGVLYRKGILFTSGTPKGPALLKFLDIINYNPKQIVFINDKKTHLKDVEDAVMARNIDFIGLRYNYSDERVANFNPQLADIQWNHSTLGRLLSDREALQILSQQ